jgi:hypothetical protein
MTRRFKAAPDPESGPPAVIDVPGEPDPCPECGEDLGEHRRLEMRRVPNPEGGRGSITARVALCGACGTVLGPA